MKVMDRYVTWTFFKIFLICFVCLTGLFIVVDAFSNLEEFVELGEKSSGLFAVLRSYYGPRALQLFDRTCALLALTAAIGTLVWMQRFNELAAVEAGGIPKSRIVRPILWCMLVVVGFSLVNRELLIPKFRESLARNAQSWDGSQSRSVTPQQDQTTGVWILNGKVTLAERKVEQAEFRLPDTCAAFAISVIAEKAERVDANDLHPAGFILSQVKRPADLGEKSSVIVDSRPVVLTARDHSWLKKDELFIVSGILLNDVAFGQDQRRYGSLSQQFADLRNPNVFSSSRQRVEVHSRVVRPALDFAILLIGLPLVISRRDRSVFMALGSCLVVVMVIQVFVLTSHGLGASHILPSAALAAWLPVMALLPSGIAMQTRLEQ